MSERVDSLLAVLAAVLDAAGPTVVFGVVGALGGVLVALGVFRAVGRLIEWRGKRSARVAMLAARGVGRAEIARRTGLAQDAVGMLLRVRSKRSGRRILPAAARFAAPGTVGAPRRNRDWNPQAVVGSRDGSSGVDGAQPARPLPFPAPRTRWSTRARQAV